MNKRYYCELCGSGRIDAGDRCEDCGSRMTKIRRVTKPVKTLAEIQNPDRMRSGSILTITEEPGPDLVMIMEVRSTDARLGALVIRCRGDETTGKMGCEGISLFTEGEIAYGH